MPKTKKYATRICRKFRFEIGNENLLPIYFQNVKVNYIDKKLSFNYLAAVGQDKKSSALLWNPSKKENLTLIIYHSDGNPVYKCIFQELKILEHTSDFYYSSSNPIKDYFMVSYGKCSKALMTNEKT